MKNGNISRNVYPPPKGTILKRTNSICSIKINTELYWISLITLFTDHVHVYTPVEQQTTDEAICTFRGRILFCVSIKVKPHKYGIRMFELFEAKKTTSTTWKYTLGHVPPTHNTTRRSVLLTDCVTKEMGRVTVCTWAGVSPVQRF